MTEPYYADDTVTLYAGDCLAVLPTLPDNSVDAVVTDPPYGLEFMGKEWDKFRVDDPGTNRHRGDRAGAQGTKGTTDQRWTGTDGRSMPSSRINYGGGKRPTTNQCTGCGKRDQFRNSHTCPTGTPWESILINPHAAPPSSLAFSAWCQLWAAECLRVLKPGGHLLAFGGTRTWHRLAVAIEDAGFEIRDTIAWLYGSGFPKSLAVDKAIDRAAGAEREVVGVNPRYVGMSEAAKRAQGATAHDYSAGWVGDPSQITAPATDAAQQWQGWGTALKPAHEPVVVARKPLVGTVAANVLAHGTGALNIDGCRIGCDTSRADRYNSKAPGGSGFIDHAMSHTEPWQAPAGRWPANVALDETAAAALDHMSEGQRAAKPSKSGSASGDKFGGALYGSGLTGQGDINGYADTGGASRFFYTAKADSGERITHTKKVLRLRPDLTPEQVDHVRARLVEVGVQVDLEISEVPLDIRAYFEEVVPESGGLIAHPT